MDYTEMLQHECPVLQKTALATETNEYWWLSKTWRRQGRTATVSELIRGLKQLMYWSNNKCYHNLNRHTADQLEDVIIGRRDRHITAPKVNNVLLLRKPQPQRRELVAVPSDTMQAQGR